MLQAINLTKTYQQHTALNRLNLSVGKGEVFCLLGQNGAGKTTTINLFLGFIAATSGKALINGIEVKVNDPATKKLIAYIPEVVTLYPNLTSLENLDFFSRLAGFRYNRAQLEEFLTRSGLQRDAISKRLADHSKGMRQKVGIAIALARNAEVIFMDEPTSGLDPKATDEFTGIVKSLGEAGKSVLMATHDIFNAVNVGTHVGIMRQGELVHTLSAPEISANDLQKLYLETI
ncbi:ABC transporter ATP-binding protein [Hufsiella ginkgonis]|uniref:ATP-binding cassette domain-containing protein n=1 Tax=Hufsiella ginkgonis TaxID=2695274 RepID=A0A7K1XSM2_9SPHI|nr:ATP-binding cassette domain-containing protein [Hufsiella ginkgonis]MXV13739.1 ATP-binding cassette domain-containing protein [Hufsiella ginkgonis]